MTLPYHGPVEVIGADGAVWDVVHAELFADAGTGRLSGALYPASDESAIADWSGPVRLRADGFVHGVIIKPGEPTDSGDPVVEVSGLSTPLLL